MKKLMILALGFLLIFAAGCGKEEAAEITSFEQIESLGKYETLERVQQQEIYEFIRSLSHEEATKHLTAAFEEALKDHDEITLTSAEIYSEPLAVSGGERSIQDLYADLVLEFSYDDSIPYDDMESKISGWFDDEIVKVSGEDPVARFRLKEVNARFEDPELRREREFTSGKSSADNKYFGMGPEQPDGEAKAMELVNGFIEGDRALSLFGPVENDQLYIEIGIFVLSDDDETELPKLAEDIANALKTEKDAETYMKNQGFKTIKIVLSTSNLGDLEYEFEV